MSLQLMMQYEFSIAIRYYLINEQRSCFYFQYSKNCIRTTHQERRKYCTESNTTWNMGSFSIHYVFIVKID